MSASQSSTAEAEAAAVDDGELVESGGQPRQRLKPLKARSMTLRPPQAVRS